MSLAGFIEGTFSANNKRRTIYQRGKGPGVVIIHEVPGITPEVAEFGRRVADDGFTAVLPVLFGVVNKPFSVGYMVNSMARACISREFTMLARGQSSPITNWLRALCRHVHQECGGPGVGALGMCLTGGFALALMLEEAVIAPVLSQPVLPIPFSEANKKDIGLSAKELATVKRRVAEGCSVLGLRFTDDAGSPGERFETLRQELGAGFEGFEIDSSPGNPHGIPQSAHSVLTNDFVDEEGHPTQEALHRVLTFFRTRLLTPNI